MTTLTLKSYQQSALDALATYARAARIQGPAAAFAQHTGRAYNADAFGPDVPCVCLRIPTGGGKTVLAAHAVPLLATEWRCTDAPVAVWLVPSDTIRAQTLKALQTSGHPYREALEAVYGLGLRVCSLDDVAQVPAPQWGRQAVVIVVATIQSFRIDDAGQRNVYSFTEAFEPHFKYALAQGKGAEDGRDLACLHALPDAVVTPEDVAQDPTGILAGFVGQPRWSLANWLALHRPIVIVDEAHNTKTDKSFTALQRLNPSCILELTATPIEARTNVLYHMGFEALDVASMIAQPATLPLFGGDDLDQNKPPALVQQALIATNFEALQATPELLSLPGVQVKAIAGAEQVVVAGHIGQEAEALMLAQVRGAKKQDQLREQVAQHNALVAAQLAPAARGVPFAPLPTLAYREDAQAPLWPLEREAVLEAVELDLLTPQAVQLPGFQVVQESDVFEISLSADARVTLRRTDVDQMAMDYGSSSISAEDLVRWLDQSLFKQLHELTQTQRRAYLAAVVNDQLHRCGVPLVVLAQARFQLVQSIANHFGDLRDAAAKQQFRQLVLQSGRAGAWLVEPDWAHPHVFEPGRYPAPVLSRYAGRYQFIKHYFPVLADLKESGEEFGCAHLLNDPYEIEKSQVGALWAQTSGGRAVFGWLTKQQGGKTLAQQLDSVLA